MTTLSDGKHLSFREQFPSTLAFLHQFKENFHFLQFLSPSKSRSSSNSSTYLLQLPVERIRSKQLSESATANAGSCLPLGEWYQERKMEYPHKYPVWPDWFLPYFSMFQYFSDHLQAKELLFLKLCQLWWTHSVLWDASSSAAVLQPHLVFFLPGLTSTTKQSEISFTLIQCSNSNKEARAGTRTFGK